MKDTIIKGTGNSRYLRSNVSADITFGEFIALLRAGQFPIDLAGINENGIEELGTALNRANLLSEETEEKIWGSSGTRSVNDALYKFYSDLFLMDSEKSKVISGYYSGNSTAGRYISLGVTPAAVLVTNVRGAMNLDGTQYYGGLAVTGSHAQIGTMNTPIGSWDDSTCVVGIIDGGFKVNWNASKNIYANTSGTLYHYIAVVK